jgi:Domain of unknown function (DUF4124)
MTLRPVSLAIFLSCVAPAVGAQTMFKCVLQGKTVYQQDPCPEAAKQDTLKAQSASPAGTPADVDSAIEVMAGYQACSDAISEWNPTHAAAFHEWKSRNAGAVARVEKDKETQRRYVERLQANRGSTVRTCMNVLDVIKPDRDKTPITRKISP